MKWLTQNAKMKRSSSDYEIFNWGIPAFRSETGIATCPNAKHCVSGCYARSGTYRFKNVASKFEARLQLALSSDFETVMQSEIDHAKRLTSKRGKKQCLIRIHDSGDWFNLDYTLTWFRLIRQNPDVVFYSYTKQIEMFKDLSQHENGIPSNLIMIFSYGGKQDHLIDPKQDRHSKVFENETELFESGYANASHNDLIAIGSNRNIGLVYHGSKKYANTTWDRVKVS